MQEFVRPAAIEDLDALVALEESHRAVLGDTPRGGPQWLTEHPAAGRFGWNERLSDSSWFCVVAGIDASVFGFASAHFDGSIAVVETIYVDAGAREVGLGEHLLDAVVGECRRRGVSRVDAAALPGDRETKNLFERAGLIARLIVVSRSLSS